MVIIYLATNTVNKKVYVGQTTRGLQARVNDYKKSKHIKNKTYFLKAIAHHGVENFRFQEIDTAVSRDDLNEKERFWIKQCGSMAPSGYNSTLGGDDNPMFHTAAVEKVAAKNRTKTRSDDFKNHLKEINTGKSHTAESRAKISASLSGRKLSDATREKMRRPKSEAMKAKLSAIAIARGYVNRIKDSSGMKRKKHSSKTIDLLRGIAIKRNAANGVYL